MVLEQLEREVQMNELKVQEGTHLRDSGPLKEWCQSRIELANRAIYYSDKDSYSQFSFDEKQRMIDRLYEVKTRIQDIQQRLINPRASLSPKIRRVSDSPGGLHREIKYDALTES